MRKLGILLAILLLIIGVRLVRADELDDISKQINELSQAREQSIAATKPLEGELSKLKLKLKEITAGIEKAKEQQRILELSITKREAEFTSQYVLLSERVQSIYKASRGANNLLVLLVTTPRSNWMQGVFYQQAVAEKDKDIIAQISLDLIQLSKDKQKAEADRVRLADLQIKADKEAKFFEGEIAGAKAYQATLSQKIASLTAQQQNIIAQKLGSLNLPQSLGAGAMMCTDDRKLDPGFGNAYAFFTFGIPHRVGMNQYGALGRANAGKSYKDILNAYFANISFESGKENIKIKIQGNGEKNLDEYLLGIYEMPENWPIEALKAQVVAARSYALAYTNNGEKEICTTQACQVWKPDKKTGQWKEAVEKTKGEVMMSGGQVVTGWYSSTDGGYTFFNSDVWGGSQRAWTKRLRDTNGDINNFEQLKEKAYDRESPCFYSAQGWRSQYNKSAWLKAEEVADIANVIMLARKDSSLKSHLYQPDKPNPEGVETWDYNRVKQELGAEAIASANTVEISGVDWGSGKTTEVRINGKTFSGGEFKDWFNLRAPVNLQIVGPLYNIEKR